MLLLRAGRVAALSALVGLVVCAGCSDDGNHGRPLTPDECARFPDCEAGVQCASGSCMSLEDCPNAICIEPSDACRRLCGKSRCAILESYPSQVSCD
jgi:hypothetical protein